MSARGGGLGGREIVWGERERGGGVGRERVERRGRGAVGRESE